MLGSVGANDSSETVCCIASSFDCGRLQRLELRARRTLCSLGVALAFGDDKHEQPAQKRDLLAVAAELDEEVFAIVVVPSECDLDERESLGCRAYGSTAGRRYCV